MSSRLLKKVIIIIIIIVILFSILFFISNKKGTGNPIADIQSGAISFRDFSPFNPAQTPTNQSTTIAATNAGTAATQSQTGPFIEPKVRQITDFPIAGFTFFEKEEPSLPTATASTVAPASTNTITKGASAPATETATAIRYMQKSNAHIFDLFTDQEDPVTISSTTIPAVHEAFFSPDGNSVVLRYLNNSTGAIESYTATVPPQPANGLLGTLQGTFLPENIWWLTFSPDGTKIFALSSFDSGTVGDVSDISGDKPIQVFSSPFDEWLPKWVTPTTVTLTTKASSNIPGYLYDVDTTTKKFSRVLGNIPGLTALMSPDGKHVLYSTITDSSVTMSMYDTKTHQSQDIGSNTLPEKCVWSPSGLRVYCAIPQTWPDGTYPDSWYQGLVSFSDDIWEIDLSGSVFSLTQLTTSADFKGVSIDAVNLQLDSSEHHLGFINKKDGTLWTVQL